MPNELNYESIEGSNSGVDYNSKTKELVIKFNSLSSSNKIVEINTKIGKLEEGKYEQQINITSTIKGDNTPEEEIETITETINKIGVKITQTSTIPEGNKIATREDFTYLVNIENLSNININNVILTDIMPKGLIYKSAKLTYGDGATKTYTKTNKDGQPEIEFDLSGKAIVKIEISVVADALENETKITNKLKLEQEQLGTIESNSITHIIEKYEGKVPEEDVTTKRIMGQVWKDENNNGIKDENETKMPNVEVMLFNNSTGKLVTDNEGNLIRVKTDEGGNYTFSNIIKGSYTVIFLYDTANYSSTAYKKKDVDETTNSDAIDSKITLDGKTVIAAITEELVISNTNIYNIDLGLISNPKFDLKLDKTVSRVTVQNGNGTKVYEYKDSKLAKVEIVGKQVNNTSIVVEYKIKVTNEGAIPGYIKKIVDYIPSELKFSSELNRDWYTSESGAIYNSSLANTVINPGESKEVTLTMTKKMSENNLGLINNTAEIYEAYNDLGIKDLDSTPGNKMSNEDDMSFADILTTVKTGETIMFIGLSIVIIAMIGVGTYFIKKKVLK